MTADSIHIISTLVINRVAWSGTGHCGFGIRYLLDGINSGPGGDRGFSSCLSAGASWIGVCTGVSRGGASRGGVGARSTAAACSAFCGATWTGSAACWVTESCGESLRTSAVCVSSSDPSPTNALIVPRRKGDPTFNMGFPCKAETYSGHYTKSHNCAS